MNSAIKLLIAVAAIMATVCASPGKGSHSGDYEGSHGDGGYGGDGYGKGHESGYGKGHGKGYGSGYGKGYGGGKSNIYHSQNGYGNYNFGYDISDPYTGNYQGRHETAYGNTVKGHYFLREADGSLRRVDYVATHPGGFVATVTDKHGSKTYGNTGYGKGSYGNTGYGNSGYSNSGYGSTGYSKAGNKYGGDGGSSYGSDGYGSGGSKGY